MEYELSLSRRSLLTGAAAAFALPVSAAEALPKVIVSKDPSCGCCTGWVEHLKASGFPVNVIETAQVNRVKVRLGVPQALASCPYG